MFRRLLQVKIAASIAIAAVLVIGSVVLALLVHDQTVQREFADFWNPLATIFGAGGLLYAARRCSNLNNAPLAKAWRTMGVAVSFYVAGGILWSVLEQGLHLTPFPSIADVFYLTYYPLFALAILRLPRRQVSPLERSKLLLEMTIALTAMALVFGSLIVLPLMTSQGERDVTTTVLTILYPAADLPLLWAICSLAIARNPLRDTAAGILLSAGMLCMVLADLTFAYLSLQGAYSSGGWTDLLYTLAGVLQGLAGIRVASMPPDALIPWTQETQSLHRAFPTPTDWKRQIPGAIVALVLLTVAWLPSGAFTGQVSFLLIGSVIFVMLIFVRQLVAMRENSVLNQTLIRTWEGLLQRSSELQTAHEELKSQVEVRERIQTEQQILESKMRQMQKLESLGVLAGGIAHDFNNLLTGILGNASLASESLPADHAANEFLEGVEEAAMRAATLTNQMLAYSGRGAFSIRDFNLNDSLRNMAQLLHASVSKKVGLKMTLKGRIPNIVGDSDQISQLVMNLITNASEAIDPGSGTIEVSTGVLEVDETFSAQSVLPDPLPSGRYVYLEVTDDGPGMEPETVHRIFEPFFTTKFTGRGLGLPATLGIIRGHKGNIQVHSEPGVGTRFTIIFPPAEGVESPESTQNMETSPVVTSSKTILVVDDENLVRSVAVRLLKQRGFITLEAQDGRQAVEAVHQHHEQIDVVLLDLMMPVMGGEEAFREIRRLSPDIPVVLSSGFTENAVTAKFGNGSPNGFLQKPFTAQQLTEVLQRAIAENPIRREQVQRSDRVGGG